MMNRISALRCFKTVYSLLETKNPTTTIGNFNKTKLSTSSPSDKKSRYNHTIKNTLQNWFLNQIELRSNIEIYKTDTTALTILKLIHKLDGLENNQEFESTLKEVDKESCKSFRSISYNESLTILNKLTRIAPHRIIETKFYQKFIENCYKLTNNDDDDDDDKKLVNLIFLIGLKKRNGAREISSVLSRLNNFRRLSLIEKAIVSTSAFKCGVKLDRDKIIDVEDTVNENIETLLTAPHIFVSFIKVLRHARPSFEFSLSPLSRAIVDNKTIKRYKISIAVPLLALYAEILEYDKEVIDKLINDSIEEISNEGKNFIKYKDDDDDDFFLSSSSSSSKEIRIKDVDRMLWAVSRLSYKLNDRDIVEIDKFIKRKFSKLLNKPDIICGMLISLWIIGQRNLNIVKYCFENEIFLKLLSSSSSSFKNRARLNLLIDCLRLETPCIKIPQRYEEELFDKKLKKIKPCKELITISQLLICMGEKFDICETKVECPIESLRIYGVTTRHKILGWIHLDIFNETTCLKDKKTPNGLMELKLRLVKAMGYNSIFFDHGGLTKIEDTVTRIEKCFESLLEKHKIEKKS